MTNQNGKRPVFLDANIFYSAGLYDIFMLLNAKGLYCAFWSNEVLDEWIKNIRKNRPDIPVEKLEFIRSRLNDSSPERVVIGYEHLIEQLELPDKNDKHVLAGAVKSGCEAIITFNLKDFPKDVLDNYGIKAIHPDEFILDLTENYFPEIIDTLKNRRLSLKNPPKNSLQYIDDFIRYGLVRFAAKILPYSDLL